MSEGLLNITGELPNKVFIAPGLTIRGLYEIRILGFGNHHNVEVDTADDANRLAVEFMRTLREHGHEILAATFEQKSAAERIDSAETRQQGERA